MSSVAAAQVKQYRLPKSVIGRFVFRRSIRGAVIWAYVFGIYVASKAIGFAKVYSTPMARQKALEAFSNNSGIELLLGRAPHGGSTAGYVSWNCLIIVSLIGSIWGLLTATKYLRGEEEVGRLEMLLSGQSSTRRAVTNTLLGLGASLVAVFIVVAAIVTAVGRYHGVGYGTGPALMFALAVILAITTFMLMGALTSQLMPTRTRASSWAGIILGIFFVLRAIGDITSYHWLLDISPLGWLERVQPLYGSDGIWLLPFVILIAGLLMATIYLAGKRELGSSIIEDHASSEAHTELLNSPLGLSFRTNRAVITGWLSAFFVAALAFGEITKSVNAAFSQSAKTTRVIKELANQQHASIALAFIGVIFFIQMILFMSFAASTMAAVRNDEAKGYLDNLIVNPYSRLRWLSSRLVVIALTFVAAAILTTAGVWIGIATQHLGTSLAQIFVASINALVPVIFVVAAGVLALGIVPRLTSSLAYGVLAWSVLIDTLGSGLKLNHWLLDSSIFNHIVFAPAVSPRWHTNLIVIAISLGLIAIGAYTFNRRDLQPE